MRFVTNRVNMLRQRVSDTFTLPERFKGTFVEKWALYWKGLLRDYAEVSVGLVKESYNKPKKALAYGTIVYGLYSCGKRNPNEENFLRQLRCDTNRLIMVSPEVQNPETIAYLKKLETAYNQNTIRLLSLGICTLLWIDRFDADDCTYPANCEFTKVSMWDFHTRVIDVGFWNQFWRLHWQMQNYDINYL